MFYFADIDTLSVFYGLDCYADIQDLSYSRRSVPASLGFRHGGVETGDGKIDTRYFVLSGYWRSKDDKDSFLSALHRYDTFALLENNPLLMRRPRFLAVSLYGMNDAPSRGTREKAEYFEATLQSLLPFWRCVDMEEKTISLTVDHLESAYDWKVNVDGGFATPAKLVFETTGPSNYQIKLANRTNGNRGFLYEDLSNTNGQIVTVDGITGSVTRGAVDERIALKGSFVGLLPGENHLCYWGNVVKVTLNYRARWL